MGILEEMPNNIDGAVELYDVFATQDIAKTIINYKNNSQLQEFIKLLKKEEKIIKQNNQKEVILIIGNTGSGKTTLTQFITVPIETLENNIIDDTRNNQTLQTDFPNLVLDTENTAFYDFPGFNDTREALNDISTNYYLKSIIDCADRVKFIFTFEYAENMKNKEKQNFASLIARAAALVDDLEKFKDSIALIITKVTNKRSNDRQYLDDVMIIENYIVNVLNDIKNVYLNTEVDTKAVQFIDIILTKKGENYPKLGIFRKPFKSRTLKKDRIWKTNQKSLKKLVHTNIRYIKPNKNNFRYRLSSNSKKYLHDLKENLNNEVAVHINNIAEDIKAYYQDQEEILNDIEDLHNTFLLGHQTLLSLHSAFYNESKPQDLKELIHQTLNNLHINNFSTNFSSLEESLGYLQFTDIVLNKPNDLQSYKWSNKLTNLLQYFNDSQKWYAFLIELNKILSNYDTQKEIGKFTDSEELTKLLDHITSNRNLKQCDNDIFEHLIKLFSKINNENLTKEYENIKNVELNKFKLNFLDKILRSTLQYRVEPSCTNNELTIKGQYVKLQDIERYKKQTSCIEPQSMSIFALDKVFIDSSLNETGKELTLFIAAPTWDVVQKSNIILDGFHGKQEVSYESDNYYYSRNGESGLPGGPGGPSGNFIGIGKAFINGENLIISANGGDAGNGENGQDGQDAENGTRPIPDFDISINTRFKEEEINKNCHRIDHYERIYEESNEYTCILIGKPCTDGGSGGLGGAGGKGGYAGNITLVHLNARNYSGIIVKNTSGKNGVDGMGGIGKPAGVDPYNIEIHMTKVVEYWTTYYVIDQPVKVEQVSWDCESGSDAHPGWLYEQGKKEPTKGKLVNSFDMIKKYKSYLRENMYGNIKEKSLRVFLDYLEKHDTVQQFYDEFAFNDELQELEELFYKSSNNLSFLSFYQSLLQRIKEYMNHKKYEKGSTERSKALNYLYAATLSKVNSLQMRGTHDLVLDIYGYLDFAMRQISEMEKLKNIAAMQQYNEDYNDSITKKIHEAEGFVDRHIMVEINTIMKDIDNEIVKLVNETLSLQRKATENKQKLIECQEKLQSAFVLKTIFNVTKTACLLLNFLGPIGTAAGAVIGAGTMVAEALLVDESKVTDVLGDLPKAVNSSLSIISEQLKTKKEQFKKQVAKMQNELKESPEKENLQDIKSKISDINDALNKGQSNKNDLDLDSLNKIQNMHDEVTDLLKNKTNALKTYNSENAKNQLKVVNKMQTVMSVTQMGVDLYDKIKSDKDKLDQASDAVIQADKKLKQLQKYELNIYNSIVPLCNSLRDTVNGVKSSMKNKSHATLDVSKWQIKDHLRDVKTQIQELTNGFNAGKRFATFIEKLNEGINAMIKIYDRIQDYQDKKELADYIFNINSAGLKNVDIKNPQLKSAIDKSKLIIQSNIVLEVYNRFMGAFSQYVYPFAEEFLNDLDLPSSRKPEDISTLVEDSTRVLNKLRTKLDESNKTLKLYKNDILDHVPFNKSSTLEPFYVWDYDTYKHTISKLLKGEEVVLKADIKKSRLNAIKFKELDIRLRFKNEMLQDQFDYDARKFAITMTHLGDSYYRCGNHIHTIATNNASLRFHLGKEYKSRNSNEYAQYPPSLSPYATWSVKLISDIKASLVPLQKYQDEPVDIELEGFADCVSLITEVCNDDLNKYYASDEASLKTMNIYLSNKSTLNRSIQTNLQRNRRSLNDNEFITDTEENAFTANGASGNAKYSLINNIVNLIGSSLLAMEYFNPVNKISQWFNKYETSANLEDSSRLTNNILSTMKLENIQPPTTDLPNISENVINDESHIVDNMLFNYSLFSNQNLLLLDLVIRRKSGVRYEQKNLLGNRNVDSAYAQGLAYREHVPTSK